MGLTQRERLRAKVCAIPVDMRFSEIKQVLEDAGWTLSRTIGSHHQFTRPGHRTLTVVEHHGKVKQDAIRQVAESIETS
jgi:predicted RNA binding protein YcfA (HicA-like mRNA interferase family)